jgi:MFS family permease
VHVVASPITRHRSFGLFWASRLLSVIAFQMLAVAIGWQIYELTSNPLDLGIVGLVQFLPIIPLTLIVGQVADRYDRRRIVAACRAIQALASVTLVLGTLGGWLTPGTIFAIVAVIGASRAFEDPTMNALLPALVPRREISRALVWYTSASQVARISGPALGGVLIVLGPAAAYAVAGVAYLLATGLIVRVHVEQRVRARAPITLGSVFAGLAFTWRTPVILGAISLDLFVVLLGGATALLPIYARDILMVGPEGLGLLRSAPAAGALAMSAVMAVLPIRDRVGPLLFGTVIVFGLATVVFGLSTSMVLSLAALAVLGAANIVSAVIRHSLVQLRTPDPMRGRVSAVNSLFTGTSNQLGDFESGVTAALLGTVASVVLGGVGTVVVALLWMVLFPEIRRTRTLEG